MVDNHTTATQTKLPESQITNWDIMMTDDLSQTLHKLHAELASNPELDASTIGSLRSLLSEIQVAIERAEGDAPQAVDSPESTLLVGQKLRSAISEFEARHPKLTLSLSQIADNLTAMGF